MSQHKIIVNGRDIIYGADKPTGGFFFTEFYREDEPEYKENNEVVQLEVSLTFTELNKFFDEKYGGLGVDAVTILLNEWMSQEEPTPLQKNTAKMFGNDLDKLIERTNLDIENLWL